ncbi:MAG TPA: hypothetical protein VMT99_02410 [Candidatus Paceibacterota bacterium]|nr:hypothetical protein [Candidatus Paceibacterota bacterium]
MRYTDEQIRASIQLAEKIAEQEMRISVFEKAGMSPDVMESARENIGGKLGNLLDDPLAEKLLPQARIAVRMHQARELSIEQTKLGRLIEAAGHQSSIEEEGEGWTGKTTSEGFFPAGIEQDEWRRMVAALKRGDKGALFDALSSLLIGCKIDLVHTELPPTAPVYRIPK